MPATLPKPLAARFEDALASAGDKTGSLRVAWQAVMLKREIMDAEDEAKAAKARLEKILDALPGVFENDDVQRLVVDGTTVSKRTELLVSRDGDTAAQQLVNVCKSTGNEDLVKENVNAQTLQKHIRDLAENLEDQGFEGEWEDALEKLVGEELFSHLRVKKRTRGHFTNIRKKGDS